MKAIVKYAKGYGNLEIREVPKPEIKNTEVLIEIKASGICGSDLQHYETGDHLIIPVILGHEFSGEVVEIGKDVGGWEIGERIVSETHAQTCQECYLCKSGNYHLCKNRKGFGSSVNGAFTKYIAVPARLLHRIPDELSYPEAALLQPAADIAHAVFTMTHVTPGDTVLVLGPGPMGLLTIEFSRVIGAGKIIVAGLDEDQARLAIATQIGGDYCINVSKEDLVEKVNGLTQGRGADVVFEVSGSKAAFLAGLKAMGRRGQMIIIGVPIQAVEIDLGALQAKEQTIQSSIMSTWLDYERVIQLSRAGKISLNPLISHLLPLAEWKKGFDLALSKKACKVIFTGPG